jgi:vitamin B12 transporter
MPTSPRRTLLQSAALALILLPLTAQAIVVRGTITTPLGTPVPAARIQLIRVSHGRSVAAIAISGADGTYEILSGQSGRFLLIVSGGVAATALQPNLTRDFAGGRNEILTRNITLEPTTLYATETPIASALPTPLPQLTAPISTISRDDLANRLTLLNELRQSTGVDVLQTGQLGGQAQLRVRGGSTGKVLIDNVPVNRIGGPFDPSLVSTTSLANPGNNGPAAELYRGANSALYGSDALASVLALSTPRGTASGPAFLYSGDAGNLHTYRDQVNLSGTLSRLDYFTAASRIDSSNALPNDPYHAIAEAANLGFALPAATSARFTLQNVTTAAGDPGPHDFLGLSADRKQANQQIVSGLTLENRWKGNWHNLLRYGIARNRDQLTTFTPVGTLVAGIYYGLNETITGANGYKATGASPVTYATTYPNAYQQASDRDILDYQSDYAFTHHLAGLFGFQYQNERASLRDPLFATNESLQHTSFLFTTQIQGDIIRRIFFSLGGAIEKDHLYGLRGTPRLGLTYVPVRPGPKVFHGTRLRANVSRGIAEPPLDTQFNSLYAALANNPAARTAYRVTPPAVAQSRTYDLGIEQNIFGPRLVLNAGYFHNQFSNQPEQISPAALEQYFAIPPGTTFPSLYGAASNTLTLRAQGGEAELLYQPRPRLFLHIGYTYLAPLVERSFGTNAFQAAGTTVNPLYPNIPIGATSPLAGQRPFQRPPNTGYFAIQYTGKRLTTAFKGAMSGKSDDSTYLVPSLLLPNRNLDHGYAQLDLALTYAATRHITVFTQLDNLLNQQHTGPMGYPGLPFTVRAGLKLCLGSE